MNAMPKQPMKRKFLALFCSLPWLGACRAGPDPYHTGDPAEDVLRRRFRGIGIELVVDAVAGEEMGNVHITTDRGYHIFGSPEMGAGSVSGRGKAIMAVGSARVPRWVRVTWGKPIVVSSDWDGPIIGDYTIPVADRIPDAVIESLRKNPKGNLRIKFRLHPEGVYFGWEIGRSPDYDPTKTRSPEGLHIFYPPGYELVGGDFKEARPAYYLWTPDGGFKRLPTDSPFSPEGKKYLDTGLFFVPSGDSRAKILWEKGWYIDKDGRKVLTDY